MATVAAPITVDRESANNVVRSTVLVILSILLVEAFYHNVILFDAMSNFPVTDLRRLGYELVIHSYWGIPAMFTLKRHQILFRL